MASSLHTNFYPVRKVSSFWNRWKSTEARLGEWTRCKSSSKHSSVNFCLASRLERISALSWWNNTFFLAIPERLSATAVFNPPKGLRIILQRFLSCPRKLAPSPSQRTEHFSPSSEPVLLVQSSCTVFSCAIYDVRSNVPSQLRRLRPLLTHLLWLPGRPKRYRRLCQCFLAPQLILELQDLVFLRCLRWLTWIHPPKVSLSHRKGMSCLI